MSEKRKPYITDIPTLTFAEEFAQARAEFAALVQAQKRITELEVQNDKLRELLDLLKHNYHLSDLENHPVIDGVCQHWLCQLVELGPEGTRR